MQMLTDVQFIPATGQPEYAVVPYPVYLELKKCEIQATPPVSQQLVLTTGQNPIRYWRQSRGLSQAALADLAQISIPYLSQLEHGVRVGSKAVLKRLAEALRVGIDQIL